MSTDRGRHRAPDAQDSTANLPRVADGWRERVPAPEDTEVFTRPAPARRATVSRTRARTDETAAITLPVVPGPAAPPRSRPPPPAGTARPTAGRPAEPASTGRATPARPIRDRWTTRTPGAPGVARQRRARRLDFGDAAAT